MAKKLLVEEEKAEEKKKDYDVRFLLNGGGSIEIISPIPAPILYKELLETLASRANNINFTGWYAFKKIKDGKFISLNVLAIIGVEEM